MAKVSIHRGVTIPHPDKGNYTMWKTDITISDIETEGNIKNVDEQIDEALEAAEKISEAIAEPLAQDAADVSALAIEGVGIAKKFEQFLVNDKAWKESVVKEVKKLQDMVDSK